MQTDWLNEVHVIGKILGYLLQRKCIVDSLKANDNHLLAGLGVPSKANKCLPNSDYRKGTLKISF